MIISGLIKEKCFCACAYAFLIGTWNVSSEVLQIEMDKYIPDKDIKSIVMLTALAGVIVLYSVISTRIKIDVTTKVGQDIIHTIREDIFKHLQELPLVIMMKDRTEKFR